MSDIVSPWIKGRSLFYWQIKVMFMSQRICFSWRCIAMDEGAELIWFTACLSVTNTVVNTERKKTLIVVFWSRKKQHYGQFANVKTSYYWKRNHVMFIKCDKQINELAWCKNADMLLLLDWWLSNGKIVNQPIRLASGTKTSTFYWFVSDHVLQQWACFRGYRLFHC